MNLQYKLTQNDTWIDVPSEAVMGTHGGTVELAYPEAIDFDGLGRACGAVGQPMVVVRSTIMTASGMAFWQSKFDDTTSTAASMYLKVYNPRSGTSGSNAWTSVSGWLARPRYSRVKVGGDDATSYGTLFYDVEISVNNCDVAIISHSYDAGSWDDSLLIEAVLDGGTW